MEVAPRYTLFTLLTLLTWFTLLTLYTWITLFTWFSLLTWLRLSPRRRCKMVEEPQFTKNGRCWRFLVN